MGKRAALIPAVEASSRRGRKGASSLSVTGSAKRKGGGSPSSKPKPARATEWTQEVRCLPLSVLSGAGEGFQHSLLCLEGFSAVALSTPASAVPQLSLPLSLYLSDSPCTTVGR